MNPRKPRAMKVLHGTFRQDRNPVQEPEPTKVEEPRKPPAHLNKWGKAFWRETVQELIDTGVLTVIDWGTFEICCDAYGQFMESKDALYRPVDPDTGKKTKRTLAQYLDGKASNNAPLMAAMNTGRDMFLKYANVLGLHPIARNKIDLAPKKKETVDPMEELLNDSTGG